MECGYVPPFRTDLSVGSLFGKISGGEFRMDFHEPGGFVVEQPYEEDGGMG